jgi:hypothetical protein
MTTSYTVTLTDVEDKALRNVCRYPQEWIENFIKERCRLAIEEIVKEEMDRMMKDPTIQTIPANKNDIVLAFPDRDWNIESKNQPFTGM